MTQNNLGIAYTALSQIREREDNLQKAINAFKEALKMNTIDDNPINYAATQNNLGGAYVALSKVRENENNLQKAINAFEEALKVYTIESYPIDYAITQNNLELARNYLRP